MEYSLRYTNTLTGIFTGFGVAAVSDVTVQGTTLDNHNVFNRLFVTDISSDEIEVPTFIRTIVEITVKKKLNNPQMYPIDKVVIPLYVNAPELTARTADTIMNTFSRINFGQRLQKIVTNKREVYYGNRGIILDKDFNILLLCTIICRKVIHRDRPVMSYYKPVVHISPQVFLENGSLINKSILKRIIPFYISHNIDSINTHLHFLNNIPEGTKPQIIIEDVNRFIEHPIKPTPQKCSDEILNQLLVDNVGDILDTFGHVI